MDLTTATPAEIDTELARLYGVQQQALATIDGLTSSLHEYAGDRGTGYGRTKRYNLTAEQAEAKTREVAAGTVYPASAAARVIERLDQARKALADAKVAAEPLNDEYLSRGGWTRAFLVTSSEGHVHSSMNCSTCNFRTTYAWMVDYSGKDEAEIVEAAGERACTVCYPSAPVDVLARPTRMFTQDEIAAQKAREEREAAKVARDAKKLEKALLPDGSTLKVGTERFTTLASARTWLTDAYWWGVGTHPSFPESAVQTVAEAVAAKEGKSVHMVRTEAEIRALKRK